VYLRARYYDPRTGVFLSRDLIEDLTESQDGYAENNLLNLVDPLGLCRWRDPWNCVDDAARSIACTGTGTLRLVAACALLVTTACSPCGKGHVRRRPRRARAPGERCRRDVACRRAADKMVG
jgi:hypothetical protein